MEVSALLDSNDMRYLSAVGLVVLYYDWALTFEDEIRYIWTASSSLAKRATIINRYVVLAMLTVVAYETCGFMGQVFSNDIYTFVCSVIAIFSLSVGNMLILSRVASLWDRRPLIVGVLAAGLAASLVVQLIVMILSLMYVLPTAAWSPAAGMCIITRTTRLFALAWGAPLLFELLVLVLAIVNAFDRPRAASQSIWANMWKDGIGYFMTLTFMRAVNVALAVRASPMLTFLAVFFIWSLTTVVLNRSLLHMHQADMEADELEESLPVHTKSQKALKTLIALDRQIEPVALEAVWELQLGGSGPRMTNAPSCPQRFR